MTYISRKAIQNYLADKAILQTLLPVGAVHDETVLEVAHKTLVREVTTEFEFKASRHELRGKKKKTLISERCAEFATTSKIGDKSYDWRVESCGALVTLFEARLDGPGP